MRHEHKDCGCQHGKDPKDCSPEQIRKCHPEGGHPCEEKAEKGPAATQK